jgi:hypothetical protein
MPRENKESSGPTPWLERPRREARMFTYSENKILDQITIEIMEAWKHDLNTIRETHLSVKNFLSKCKKIQENIDKNFTTLEKLMAYTVLPEKITKINLAQDLIIETLSTINEKIDTLQHTVIYKKRKWWHRIFKLKT